jgi:hypothetical protein
LTLPPLIAQREFASGSVPRVVALVTAVNQTAGYEWLAYVGALSPVDAVRLYKELADAERPIYHQTDTRVHAHIFDALAHFLHWAIEKKLKAAHSELSDTEALTALKSVYASRPWHYRARTASPGNTRSNGDVVTNRIPNSNKIKGKGSRYASGFQGKRSIARYAQ